MGKGGKKPRKYPIKNNHRSAFTSAGDGDGEDYFPSAAYNLSPPPDTEPDTDDDDVESPASDGISKFDLYQRSVQLPKGDISYLQKFFLMYVGGRVPLHLQEDFCGTALLCSEWLRGDARRTAVGIDLDQDALNWCLENNLSKFGSDGSSRAFLFHGNVLQPQEACLVKHNAEDLMKNLDLSDRDGSSEATKKSEGSDPTITTMKETRFPARDIICAFNYSCCCLHKRTELILYFKHAFHALSKSGGIFVMDLYGGTSSERQLRLQRKFSNFTYVWEQADFDIINRKTRISLHFQLGKKKMLRHAFSYDWHLWTLPELKDCLLEAGFQSVHFWIREMPDIEEGGNSEEYYSGRENKYEERSSFQQQDAWNAYIVGVANE